MAATEPQQRLSSSSGGIQRLLHQKKGPESHQRPLLHPTAATSSAIPTTTTTKKKKMGFALRGLGCASASSASQALAPDSSAAAAAVRSSADWQGKRRPRRRRGRKPRGRAQVTSPPAEVADVSDVWCAPGVVFGAEASVDCVVAHHRRERIHRERHCTSRAGGNDEVMTSTLDCPYRMEMQHFGSGALHSGHLRYMRRRSPAEYEEMMMFQTRVFLGGVDVHDQYKDLRLDVDNMSYEELLELSERIGYVNTGLREEEIFRNLRKQKHSLFAASPSQKEWKCIICQEEYQVDDDVGKLECGHSYHTHCIKQWLLRKNVCPVCKATLGES